MNADDGSHRSRRDLQAMFEAVKWAARLGPPIASFLSADGWSGNWPMVLHSRVHVTPTQRQKTPAYFTTLRWHGTRNLSAITTARTLLIEQTNT